MVLPHKGENSENICVMGVWIPRWLLRIHQIYKVAGPVEQIYAIFCRHFKSTLTMRSMKGETLILQLIRQLNLHACWGMIITFREVRTQAWYVLSWKGRGEIAYMVCWKCDIIISRGVRGRAVCVHYVVRGLVHTHTHTPRGESREKRGTNPPVNWVMMIK